MNNDTLVDYICSYKPSFWNRPGCERVLQAMRRVDRGKFVHIPKPVPTDVLQDAVEFAQQYHRHDLAHRNLCPEEIPYLDTPLSIGHQQTCSQPSVVALMAVLLQLEEGMNVLEVGTGCGYNAAVLVELAGPSGHVTSLERIASLAEQARQNLSAHFGGEYEQRVTIIHGNGVEGHAEKAPYQRVVFTAGIGEDQFYAAAIAEQCPDGRNIYPHSRGPLVIEMYRKRERIVQEAIGQFAFVSLKRGVE